MSDVQSPVTVLHYRLTRADALAWLALRREVTGLRRVAFILWFALAGAVLAFVPVSGAWSWAALVGVVAVQYALMVAWLTLWRHWGARRMLPAPVDRVLEVWGDHLTEGRGAVAVNVAPELIRQVVVTGGHVFIDVVTDVVILPLRAFDDADDMRAFAARWDDLSRDAAV